MALTFPLSLAAFSDRLRVNAMQWRPLRYDETTGLGSGTYIRTEIHRPKWRAIVSMAAMDHRDADDIQATVEAVNRIDGQFYLASPINAGPRDDPDGSILGANSVTIYSIGSDNTSLRLAGLPVGYTISRGDFFSFSFGSNPTRRGFHRFVEDATANGNGRIPTTEVEPYLKTGTTTTLAVSLVPASCLMQIVDWQEGVANEAGIVTGLGFTALEVDAHSG